MLVSVRSYHILYIYIFEGEREGEARGVVKGEGWMRGRRVERSKAWLKGGSVAVEALPVGCGGAVTRTSGQQIHLLEILPGRKRTSGPIRLPRNRQPLIPPRDLQPLLRRTLPSSLHPCTSTLPLIPPIPPHRPLPAFPPFPGNARQPRNPRPTPPLSQNNMDPMTLQRTFSRKAPHEHACVVGRAGFGE